MRLLTGLLFAAARLSSRVSIVLNYAACGTMSLADVKEGIRRSWEGFHSREEDIATGLMDWERDLVARFVRPGEAVLIVGAGSGRDVIPLVERHCHVTGIDPAAAALGIAREVLRARQLPATLIEGFFEDVAVPGRFDVVMFSYFSYSYVPEARRRIAALRKAASCLPEGGRVLISYSPLPRPHPLLIRVARATAAICRTDWRLEPGDHIAIQESAFRGYTHAFADGEIEREAQAADLDVVHHVRHPDPVAALQMRAEARPCGSPNPPHPDRSAPDHPREPTSQSRVREPGAAAAVGGVPSRPSAADRSLVRPAVLGRAPAGMAGLEVGLDDRSTRQGSSRGIVAAPRGTGPGGRVRRAARRAFTESC